MSTIVLRSVKGEALTFAEGDANFTNLNNDKLENITNESIGDLSDVSITGITTGQTLVWDAATSRFAPGQGSGGSGGDLVSDTTPQLGGDLDVNGNAIVSTSNGDIELTPNGTGRVVLSGQRFPAASSSLTGTVTDVDAVREPNTLTLSNTAGLFGNEIINFSGTGVSSIGLDSATSYRLNAGVGGDAYEIALASGGGPISLTDPGTITDVNYTVSVSSVSSGSILTYGPGGELSWMSPTPPSPPSSPSLSSLSDVSVMVPITDGHILVYNSTEGRWKNQAPAGGSGDVTLGSFSASTSGDGTLTYNNTNGVFTYTGPGVTQYRNALSAGTGIGYDTSTGVISSTVTAGISDLVQDTTPQLGGNLDVNGQQIVSVSNGNIVLAPNGTGMTMLNNIEYHEKVHSLGTTSGTIAPNAVNGNVQTITLNGNLTINAFTSPVSGQTITLIITTGGTGRTLTSSMLFAGGSKTLSTTSTVDILTMSYIGTTYYASLVKGYA
jgi:hypothetical protein